MYDGSIILVNGIVEEISLYAYQQQTTASPRRLHVVPDRRARVLKPVRRKTNRFANLLRLIVVMAFLLSFAYFVLPTSFSRLIKNVFFPVKIPVNIAEQYNMAKIDYTRPAAAEMYSIANPTTNYLSNDLFMNRLLLAVDLMEH